MGEIRRLGGVFNASTGMDSAEYDITVPQQNFKEALGLLADMVMEPAFSHEDIEREREVILKELKLYEDDPESMLMKELFSQAYIEHVYKHPIIGHTGKFKDISREDISAYHAENYTPDHMVIGVIGGVPAEEASRIVKEKFSQYKRGGPRPCALAPEPPQIGARSGLISADIGVGYLAIGFHSTNAFSPDVYPMDVLSILLGGGRDSRLYERLVREKELLYSVSCSNLTPRYPGLFVIMGTGEPGNIHGARQEIFSVIEELKKGKITREEIERAKNMVSSGFLFLKEKMEDTISTVADTQLILGDPYFMDKYIDNVQKVSQDEIKAVAFTYLREENSTTIELFPDKFAGEQTKKAEDVGKAAEDERSMVLPNGLKLDIKKRGNLPIVSATIAFAGGLRAETEKDNGIANLTSSLLLKGTMHRGENEIVPTFEEMGGSIRSFSGYNSMGVTMSVLSKDFEKGLDIFADVVMNPSFPSLEIEKQKKNISAVIMQKQKDIFSEGMFEAGKLLYEKHPYSMRPEGTIETVAGISRDGIESFHGEYFQPAGAVMTVVGDVDIDKTARSVLAAFKGWKGGNKAIQYEEVTVLEKTREKEITMEKEQSFFAVVFRGVTVKDDRKFALFVINEMLSGGGGMLFEKIRGEEGLAYTTGSSAVPLVDPGYFLVYAGTVEKGLEKVRSTIFDLITGIKKGAFSDEQMVAAKNRALTEYAASLQTNGAIGLLAAFDELYALGPDAYKEYPRRISAVTRDDIVQCANDILDLDKCVIVTVHSSPGKKE